MYRQTASINTDKIFCESNFKKKSMQLTLQIPHRTSMYTNHIYFTTFFKPVLNQILFLDTTS